jgi:cholesterol transport system auxiliary component
MTIPGVPATASLPSAPRLKRLAAAVLLAAGLAGCGSFEQPPTTFDLSVPEGARQASPGGRLLVVAEPVALQALESDRIVVRASDGTVSFLPGVQWADRLPRLLQARMVQSFENSGRSVGRAGNGLSADVALTSDIRFFGVRTDGGAQAVVELSAKLVSSDGRIERARVFRAATPLASVEGRAAAAALDQSMTKVLADLVRWAGRG